MRKTGFKTIAVLALVLMALAALVFAPVQAAMDAGREAVPEASMIGRVDLAQVADSLEAAANGGCCGCSADWS